MANTKHKYRCSICLYFYDSDETVLNHPLSPICIGCLIDQEQLDMDDVDLDGIADFYEEVREIQELERRNHGRT